MRKTGNTPFAFEQLAIEMDEDVFLPVQALNALRRRHFLHWRRSFCRDTAGMGQRPRRRRS
ncbi:MAG: DUF3656 domain-containing protein [Roseburia hominis]